MTQINLEQIAEDFGNQYKSLQRRLIICAGTGCIANGSLKLHDALIEEIKKAGIDVIVELKGENNKGKTLL